MRKVNLRMKEQNKYEVIKEVVEHGLSKERASLRLGIKIRQINRLIIIYKEKGKSRICSWEQIQKARQDFR